MLLGLLLPLVLKASPPTFTPAQWTADLEVLHRGLTEVHGGTYRYTSPKEFEARWKELKSEFSRPRSRAEGYLVLSKFTRSLRCGHTYLNFFNQESEVQQELFAGRDKLPFTFKWVDDRMIVTESVQPQSDLPRGTEVLSINGKPAAGILQKLLGYTRGDGANDDKRRALLQVMGREGIETFDVFFSLLYPLREPHFALLIRLPGSKETSTVTVGAIDLQERNAKFAAARASMNTKPIWADKMLDSQTAYLDMPSWELYSSKWDWKTYLDKFFERITAGKVPKLIIDLRENEGGNSVSRDIIRHLVSKPTTFQDFVEHVRYRKIDEALKPYLSTWDKSFEDWGKTAVEVAPHEYVLDRHFDDSKWPLKAADHRYEGKVIVLMGPTNSSATFSFLADMKRLKLGTLIGQQSGGNRRGINGGAFFFLKLPNSKLEVDLPLIRYEPRTQEPNKGIRPDIFVRPTVDAIAEGIDQELAVALKL